MSYAAATNDAEFVLPTAIVKRRPGNEPDKVEGAVKASWITAGNVYTVTEFEKDQFDSHPYFRRCLCDPWDEFDPGSTIRNSYDDEALLVDHLAAVKQSCVLLGDVLYRSPERRRPQNYVIERNYSQDLYRFYYRLGDFVPRDAEGQVVDSELDAFFLRFSEITEKVAEQVADAVVAETTCKGERYESVIKGRNHMDMNFQNSILCEPRTYFDGTSHDEIKDRCESAGIECTVPVFTSGAFGPRGIMVDENFNFLGIAGAGDPGYVPRDWILVQFIDRGQSGRDLYTNESIFLWEPDTPMWEHPGLHQPRFAQAWRKAMVRKLSERGFQMPDPSRLVWRKKLTE